MGTGGLVVGGDLRLLVAEVVLHEPGDGAARVLGGGEEVGPQLRLLELARRHDLEGLEAGALLPQILAVRRHGAVRDARPRTPDIQLDW